MTDEDTRSTGSVLSQCWRRGFEQANTSSGLTVSDCLCVQLKVIHLEAYNSLLY